MSFVNLQFWALFLPLSFLAYALMRSAKGQNAVLLLASLVFYASYDLKYLLLLVFCTALGYLGGRLGGRDRRIYIAAALGELLVLLVFKYTGFALGSIQSLTGLNFSLPEILLPVGLSFYVFQSCSYLFDSSSASSPRWSPGPYRRAGSCCPKYGKSGSSAMRTSASLSWSSSGAPF